MHQPEKSQRLKYIGWEEFMKSIEHLLLSIPMNYKIYGIPRNGTIISCIMSHQRPDLIVVMNPEECDMVIDDIHDTGDTLDPYINDGYMSATLYWREKDSILRPNAWSENVKDEWIVFPWERMTETIKIL